MTNDVHAARLTAQLLSGPPANSVVEAVEHLLAVQAQDPRGARLAVRARTRGLHQRDVDAALDEGSLVVSWLNRGTLHLVRSDDYWWLQALTTRPLTSGNARRLQQEGVSPEQADRGVAQIERALSDGPRTRDELREVLRSAGVPVQGQALVHVLMLASLRGLVVRGPMRGTGQAFVLVEQWLGCPPAVDRDRALAQLARRYLRGHGPADEHDLARWAGLPLREVRRGLALIAEELVAQDGLVDLRGRPEPAPLPPPRLLGAFDPVLLGWTSRADVVGEHRALVTRNGLFRPFAMVRGRAVATWTWNRGSVRMTPLEDLSDRVRQQLERDAVDVAGFLS